MLDEAARVDELQERFRGYEVVFAAVKLAGAWGAGCVCFLSLVVERIGWLVGSFVWSFVVGGGGEDGGGKTEMRRRVETNEKRKTQRWRDTRRIAV